MSDDLQRLLTELKNRKAYDRGETTHAEFYATLPPIIVCSEDASGVLVLPAHMPPDLWEVLAAAQAASATDLAAAQQAYYTKLGLPPPRPEPEPEPTSKPAPTSRSTRPKRDNPITTVFKSLARTRKLHR